MAKIGLQDFFAKVTYQHRAHCLIVNPDDVGPRSLLWKKFDRKCYTPEIKNWKTQIPQYKFKSFENLNINVYCDTKDSKFLDFVDFQNIAFSVNSVKCRADGGRRRISHWKWKLSYVPQKLRYPPKKMFFQFSPILAFTGLFLRKIYIRIYLVQIP